MPLALPHSRIAEIDAFWSRELGCPVADLSRTGTTVHGDDRMRPNVVRVFHRGDSTVVRAHPNRTEQLTQAIGPGAAFLALDAAAIAERLGLSPDAVTPLQDVTYLDAHDFRPVGTAACTRLTAAQKTDLRSLQQSGTRFEARLANVEIEHPVVFGYYSGGLLVSAGSLIFEGGPLADVGVLTHPHYRNRGFGQAVVSALCRWGLNEGRIIQYSALCSNLPSLQVARGLGFRTYGREESLLLPM